jgi:hypothetical protein
MKEFLILFKKNIINVTLKFNLDFKSPCLKSQPKGPKLYQIIISPPKDKSSIVDMTPPKKMEF